MQSPHIRYCVHHLVETGAIAGCERRKDNMGACGQVNRTFQVIIVRHVTESQAIRFTMAVSGPPAAMDFTFDTKN